MRIRLCFADAVLPDLVDDEDDVLLSGLSADQIDHFLDARLLGLPHVERQRLEVLWPFELRIELGGEPGRDGVGHERLVMNLLPRNAVQLLRRPRLECVELLVPLQHAFELGDFEVLRVSGPLQHFQIEDGRNVLHRGAGQHFAREIQKDHHRVVRGGYLVEQALGRGSAKLILQKVQKAFVAGLPISIERKSKILREGTLAGAVEP